MTANTQHIIIREKWRCWSVLLLLLLSACSDYEYSIYDPLSPNYIDKDAPVAEEVDLGLSVNWASWNVGATAPEEYGGYYAWGEVKMRDNYTKGFYSYYNGDYNIDIGKNISGTSYDVAHVKWGNGWRMPTENEFKELCNKCSWTYIVLLPDSIAGYLVGGPNGNSLFLPMTGYYVNKRLSFQDSYGCYWSGTSWGDFSNPYGLHIKSSKNSMYPYSVSIDLPRYYGLSVRPVRDKEFKMSIAELLKTGEGTAATVQGTIVAKHTRGILLNDETGYILVSFEEESGDTRQAASVNATRSVSSYTVGDVVTVEGVVTSDAGLLQLPSTSKIQKVDTAEVVHPEPEVWNSAAFYNYFDNISVRYVKYTGVLSKEDEGYIVTVSDSAITAIGQITYPASDLVNAINEGEEVQVIGYAIGYTDEKYVRTMVTSVKVVGQPIDETAVAEAVDLGLSVKWASWNVGATAPEEYGGYYAWGETEVKENYDWSTYKYWSDLNGDGSAEGSEMISIGFNISGTSYDVTHVKWGNSWRMPALDEIKELCNNCSWIWTEVNGIRGRKVTGPNGNSIFLPAAGFHDDKKVYGRGSDGYYLSSILNEYYILHAYNLGFSSNNCDWGYNSRSFGYSVRPVQDNDPVEEEPIVETIEGILASGEGKTVKTQGAIVATHAQGILLHDETGYIHVRLDTNTDNVVGDVVTVKGNLAPWGGLLEFGTGATIERVGTEEVVHPEAVVWDGVALDNYLTSPIIQYVQYTGVLSQNGGFYNITVDDATTAVGRVLQPSDGLLSEEYVGQHVRLTGYTVGCTEDKYVETMVTAVEVVAPPIKDMTIAEFISSGEGTTAKVQATIVATHTRGFLLNDGTGYIYTYLGEDRGYAVGDVVTVTGGAAVLDGLLSFSETAVVEKVGTTEVVHPEPVVWDGAALDSYLTSPIIQYVQYDGYLNDGYYKYCVHVTGATRGTGRICYPIDDNLESLKGKKVRIIGYVFGYVSENTIFSYVNTMITSISELVVKDAVDLGLSIKWASCNVGATDPENFGESYAWGETEEKDDYDWLNYKWGGNTSSSMTKYCIYGSTADNKTILEPEDDVAHVKWGGNWRMPTEDEIKELMNKCSWEWTSVNGVNGQKVTGPNGNSIFLPAVGTYIAGSVSVYWLALGYWSSTLYNDMDFETNNHACSLFFDSEKWSCEGTLRYNEQFVRPVYGDEAKPDVDMDDYPEDEDWSEL